jgi:hypothetical protein
VFFYGEYMSQDQNQVQGIAPLAFFPPFPPFPVVPLYIPGNNNDTINVGGGTINVGGNPSPVTVTEVTTPEYTATATDYFLCVDHTGQVVITFPTGIPGTVYIVKDCSGNASVANPIIVQGTAQNVDGATATINTPYGSLSFIFNGTEWSIV